MAAESKAAKLKRLRKFWKTHLDKWAESGLTQVEYCRQHHLIVHRFTYWKARYKKSHNLPVKFVQVVPNPTGADSACLKLNVARGLQIEIPDHFCEDTLSRVLTTLRVL